MTDQCPACGSADVTQVADNGNNCSGTRFEYYQCGTCFQRFQEVSAA